MRTITKWATGLVMAALVGLSGCCSPMSCEPMYCGTPCWMEQLQDSAACFSDNLNAHACSLKSTVAYQINCLKANLPSVCGCDSCRMAHGSAVSSCAPHHCEQCGNSFDVTPAPRLTQPSPIREPAPAGPRARRCRRCQHVTRPQGMPYQGTPAYRRQQVAQHQHLDANCAAPQEFSLPPETPQSVMSPVPPPYPPVTTPAPTHQEPMPVPPEPAPPLTPGPTPLRQAPPTNISPRTAEPPPEVDDTGVEMQSGPSEEEVQASEGPILEQVGFEDSAGKKRSGWQPVRGSRPVSR